MSLHKFAKQVAANGRGDDSLLVHMTPDEVQRLQAFAQANGRSLTINPDTGLPEAGMLSDLFKMVAPIALGAFLGPAGAAFGGGLFASAATAGLAVGGITTLATGSLSRGLMAGLGAYGGAGLAESLMSAGAGAGMTEALAGSSSGNLGQAFGDVAASQGSSGQAFNEFLKSGANPATMSGADMAGAGFKAAAADPMAFAKQNFGNIAAAAAPIMAGAMVPTTTKMPDPRSTGYIRQYDFNINPDTGKPDPLYGLRAMTPVKASEFGNKTFEGQRELFRSQNPYQGGVAALQQPQSPYQLEPTRLNSGGIVALAGGGVSAADIQAYLSANPGMSDADIAAAMNQYGVSTADMAAATGSDVADIQSRYDAVQPAAPAATVAEPEPTYSSTTETGAPVYEEPTYTPAPAAPAAPVAPTRSVIEPEETVTAPTGIETLTAAMPPVAPVAPVAPAKPTDAEIVKFLTDNPTVSDADIATIMRDTGLKPEDIARATGSNVADVQTRYDAVTPTTPPTEKPTGIETLTAPVTPPAAPVAPKYNQYTNEQIAQYLKDNPTADIDKAIKETNADPKAVNAYIASIADSFRGSTDTTGGSGTLGIYNQMKAQGVDSAKLYKAEIANDPKYAGYTQPMIQKAYDLSKGAYELANKIEKEKIAPDPKLGYDKEWVKFMDTNKYSIDDMAQAFGLSRNEVKARYDAAKKEPVKPITFKNPVTGGTMIAPDRVTTTVLPTDPTVNAPPGTKNPYGGPNNPGDKTYNPDGSITVQPNIPGRPYGGFSGVDEVKNAYTAGGGSTGYVPKAPKTAAEHAVAYNRMTGDSAAAYNYLMGKGANPVKSGASQIAVPYNEYVLGRKMTKPVATTATTKKVIGVLGQPQTYFNEAEYLAANPDVAAELKTGKSVSGQPTRYTSGYEHYLMYGKSGGRAFTGDYEGYLTAAALANAANAGGGGGDGNTTGPASTASTPGNTTGNAANSISGLAQDANPNISVTDSSVSTSAPGPADAAVGDFARGGMLGYAIGGGLGSLGSYSDGGRLLKGPGDGVSDSIPATIGRKQQPARLADGEFVIPARIVSELGNGSTDAGAKKLYAMMDRVQRARGKTTGKNKVAANSRADKYLPA